MASLSACAILKGTRNEATLKASLSDEAGPRYGDQTGKPHGRETAICGVIKCLKKVEVVKDWTENEQPHGPGMRLTPGGGWGGLESHHSASLCSTSLRKPVWNLCRGSKVEKMVFFRDSGVASSSPTAFWKD